MRKNNNQLYAVLLLGITLFLLTPIDDVIFISLFGTSFFGFDSPHLWLLVVASTAFTMYYFGRSVQER